VKAHSCRLSSKKKKERDPLRLLSRPMFNGLQMLSSPPSSARQLFSLLASSPARRGWSLPITSGPTRSTPGRYSTPRPSPTPWSTSAPSSRVNFAPLFPRHFAFRLGSARTLAINTRGGKRLKLALENVVSVKLEKSDCELPNVSLSIKKKKVPKCDRKCGFCKSRDAFL
jgi:hypothetical protein